MSKSHFRVFLRLGCQYVVESAVKAIAHVHSNVSVLIYSYMSHCWHLQPIGDVGVSIIALYAIEGIIHGYVLNC